MTDHFTECLVKKIPDSSDNLKKFLIILAAVVFAAGTIFISFATHFYLILIITIALFYGLYYFIKGMSIEYEYTFTNGELDIDKIMGQRKRQHLITVEAEKFEAFDKMSGDIPEKPNATLFLCSDNTGEGEYYADLTTEEYGETRIIFTPTEKMVSYIEDSLSPILKYHKRQKNID